jgi:hypothetical protein
LLTALATLPVASATTIYVSATGSDSNAGTAPDAPLATLHAAVVGARKHGADAVLLSGRLAVTETVTMNSYAQNLEMSQWPGQPDAVLSGGVEVGGWARKPGSPGVWRATLPAAAAAALSNTSAGSIFVAGVRRGIVRTPTLRWSTSVGAKGSADSKRGFVVAPHTLDPKWKLDDASLAQWRVGAYHSWTKAFHTVTAVDAASGILTFGEAAAFSCTRSQRSNRHRSAHIQPPSQRTR